MYDLYLKGGIDSSRAPDGRRRLQWLLEQDVSEWSTAELIETYIHPMLITATTAILVFLRIWRPHTIAVGMGMMMRSMKMLSPQLAMINARLLMHLPPLTTFPLAST